MKSPEEFYIYSYTPISDPDAKGYFDLMIKVWFLILQSFLLF